MVNFPEFDVSRDLDSEEMIAEFLAATMKDQNPEAFIAALGYIAKAKGMTTIARNAGLDRVSLYKALRSGSKLRYETVQKVLAAVGVRLTVASKVT